MTINLKEKRKKLIVDSVDKVQQETTEFMLNEKIKDKMEFINKNKNFLGLVKTWKIKTLEMAAKLSDFIPEAEKRIEFKFEISKKINEFREENLPLTKRRYSR